MQKLIFLLLSVLVVTNCKTQNTNIKLTNEFIGYWEAIEIVDIQPFFKQTLRFELEFTAENFTILLSKKLVETKNFFLYYEGGKGLYSFDSQTLNLDVKKMFTSEYVDNVDNVHWIDFVSEKTKKKYTINENILIILEDANNDGDYDDPLETMKFIKK